MRGKAISRLGARFSDPLSDRKASPYLGGRLTVRDTYPNAQRILAGLHNL